MTHGGPDDLYGTQESSNDEYDTIFSRRFSNTREAMSSFSLMNIIDMIREILKSIKASPQKLQKFVSICFLTGEPQTAIKLDVRTRWNSLYYMLDWALKHKRSLINYLGECYQPYPTISSSFITESEWLMLKCLVNTLAVFEELTQKFSSALLQVNDSLLAIYGCHEYLSMIVERDIQLVKKNLVRGVTKKMDRETEKESEERIGRALLKLIPTELQKAAKTTLHYFEQQAFRYTDQSDLLHFCSLLDPTKKLQPIKSNISSQDYEEVKNGILSSLKSYSSLIKKLSRPEESSEEDSGSGQRNSMGKVIRADERENGNSNSLFTSLADIAMDRDNEIEYDRGMKRTFKTELLEYLDEPLLTNRNIKQSWVRDNHFDVLSYWRDKTRDWPKLAFFCRCLYATMATSVICERSFSFSSHILGKLRNKLSSTNLETLMLLKMNRVYGSPGSGDLDDEMF